MDKYKKKPVVIEAIQLNWDNWGAICDLLGDYLKQENPDGATSCPMNECSDSCGDEGDGIVLNVRTTHGEIAVVRHGDWIIPDSKPGTFYPCKPDVFDKNYEAVQKRTFEYRVLTYEEFGNRFFAIHEVFKTYGVIDGFSETSVDLIGKSPDELRVHMVEVCTAFEKEVIDMDKFPEIYNP